MLSFVTSILNKVHDMLTYSIIFLITVFSLLIEGLYKRYKPQFDLVKSGNKYILFLWYYKYDDWEDRERVYTKLFTV